jgi:tellurium resistance protein TerD
LRSGPKVSNPQNFVFYNNLKSPCESVALSGDNRTGAGEGDDESISVDLEKIPNDIDSILFAISIHKAEERNQNFGQVNNSFVHLQNQATGKEIVSYNLAEQFSSETLIIVGEIVKKSGEWIFEAKAEGRAGGLKGFLEEMGLEVA